MENYVSGLGEEQEFEKGVQNLLHHFVILLFGSKQFLENWYQI